MDYEREVENRRKRDELDKTTVSYVLTYHTCGTVRRPHAPEHRSEHPSVSAAASKVPRGVTGYINWHLVATQAPHWTVDRHGYVKEFGIAAERDRTDPR